MNSELTYIDNLILSGALEVAGIGEDGKFTYQFTDKLEEVDPELKHRIENGFYEAVMYLWQAGFLIVSSIDGEGTVTLSDKATSQEDIDKLDIYYQKILSMIIDTFPK